MNREPCYCNAYPFPHRYAGGDCTGEDDLVAWDRPTIDEVLDDPRRGQAASINRERNQK